MSKFKIGVRTFHEEGVLTLFRKTFRYLLPLPLDVYNFKIHTAKNRHMSRIKYDAPAEPHKILRISPKDINHKIDYSHFPFFRPEVKGLGNIKGGGWDVSNKRMKIKQDWALRGLLEHFEDNKPWDETIYYKHLYYRFKGKNSHQKRGYEDVETLLSDHVERYDRLYNEIKNNGYKVNSHGSRMSPGASNNVRDSLEIIVAIGREGDIYFIVGNHRFAIARALNVDIPVQVVCRHVKWQQIRDDIWNSGFIENYKKYIHHPDLQDITNSR